MVMPAGHALGGTSITPDYGEINTGLDNGKTHATITPGDKTIPGDTENQHSADIEMLYATTLQKAVTNGVGSPYAISVADWGKTLTNTGAVAKVYHTLPVEASSPLGLVVYFANLLAVGTRIVAPAATTIRNGNQVSAAAGYIETTVIGATLCLRKVAANSWVAEPMEADWLIDAGAAVSTQPANSVDAAALATGAVTPAKLNTDTVNNGLCEGRLTLTSGTPVTTADVATSTNVYFAPYRGNRIALYDGANWKLYKFTELTLALGVVVSGKNYDVFVYDNAGTLTLEQLVWTNDSTRATALALQDGVLVKSGAATRRYLGTFRTVSVSQTTDTARQRFLFNYYNRVPRKLKVTDTTDNWSYTTATWRQSNGAAGNQIEVVIGWAECVVELESMAVAANTNAGVDLLSGIGIDVTNANSSDLKSGVRTPGAGYIIQISSFLQDVPAVGFHFYAWVEYSTATGTTTWYGDAGTTNYQSGVVGSILN